MAGANLRAVSSPRATRVLPAITAAAAVVLIVLWLAFLLFGRHLPAATWARIIPGFADVEALSHLGPSAAGSIPSVIANCLTLLTLVTVAAFALIHFRGSLERPEIQERLMSGSATFGVTWVLFEGMITRGFEASWYNIQTMMTNSASVPVFGQRLLLIWPAILIKHLAPRLSYIQAFLAIQFVALAIAVYLTGEWSAIFIGRRLKFLGQILLAVFLVPTFYGYTAHDAGIILIYTLCFLLLYQKRYWAFGAVFCLGILNHPNILLMIPTAAATMWRRESLAKIAGLTGLTSLAYVLIRIVLNLTIPLAYGEELRIWWNMRMIGEFRKVFVMGMLTLLPWYIFAAAVFRNADPFLQAAAILLPLQIAVFSIFGQLNEARLFDGFVPVLVGIFLCAVRAGLPGDFTAVQARSA